MNTTITLEQKLQSFTAAQMLQFQHSSGLTYSGGVKYLCQRTDAYWLIRQIARHQHGFDIIYDPELKTNQHWQLSAATPSKGVLRCYRLGGTEPVIEQGVDPQGFPLTKLNLMVREGLLLLPNEYES